MLLDVDGLDEGWENSVNASSSVSRWQRSAGNFDSSDIPAPIRRLHERFGIQNHAFDLSSMGRGNNAPSVGRIYSSFSGTFPATEIPGGRGK